MNFHQPRPPLTPTELARRKAVLSENQPATDQPIDPSACGSRDVEPSPYRIEDHISNEPGDERQYGRMAAQILRDAKRSVALASDDAKFAVFHEAVATLAEAVAGQWLPKNIMVDRLQDIAAAHGFFGQSQDSIQEIIGEHSKKIRPPISSVILPPLSSAPPSALGLDVVCMADVKPTSIDWLWQNWIALGKVSVLAGDGGRGKSTILCDLTARTTTGNIWPDGGARCAPASVIILAAEDDVGDTLAPRLLAAGADLTRVFVIRSVRDESQRRRGFNLQADLERLEAEIRKHDNVKLVVIDPISSYLGKVDSHKNADVRSVLEPLGEMAGRLRVAVICNNHFSKGGGSANGRIIGSVAFVNQARAAFIVTPDEDDETRMLLIPSKMNIAPIRHGLAYRIEGCLIEFEGQEIATSRIMFESTPITITADQALAALDNSSENRSEKSEAIDFLTDALREGPVSAKDLKRDAGDAGISPKSLRSARETLGIKPEKTGFEGGWVWKLPKVPSEVEDAREL
jgi:putative DNA primase/helicase